MFVGSKTGRDDAAFVFIRVGDEERRMRWAEWDASCLVRPSSLVGSQALMRPRSDPANRRQVSRLD